LSEEDKSPRRTTAVLNITTEPNEPNPGAESAAPKKSSLKRYVLEKLRTWVNSLLEAERDEFLG
jgi:predicted secreted protein